MSITLYIKVEDVNSLMDDSGFASIQLERSTAVDGAYALVTTITLVEDQTQYSYEDTAGSVTSWYRYRYYNSVGPLASAYTNPFTPPARTRVDILHQALDDYDAGLVLLATSGGSTTLVPTTDYRFKDGSTANKGIGGWVRPSTGTLVDQSRNVTATDPAAGTLTVSPAFSGGITNGDEIEWHWLVNPDQWFRAINRGLARYWYLDRVPIVGDGNPEQALSYLTWLTTKKQVMGVWYYPLSTSYEQAYSWWNARQENGYLTLMTSPTLTTADTVYLEALRRMDPLYTDESVLAPSCNIELAAALAYDEVLLHLMRAGSTASSQDRSIWALARQQHLTRLRALYRLYGPSPRRQTPTLSQPSLTLQPWSAR